MKISTRGRYGLRALLYLAAHSSNELIPLNVIAEGENISLNYLEQIFSSLRKAGIITSVKGPQGGYYLSSKSCDIKVIDIIRILEGEYSFTDDKDNENLSQQAINNLLWNKVDEKVEEILNNTTLEDLVNEFKRLKPATSCMYYI